jgi:hypothetical protein
MSLAAMPLPIVALQPRSPRLHATTSSHRTVTPQLAAASVSRLPPPRATIPSVAINGRAELIL